MQGLSGSKLKSLISLGATLVGGLLPLAHASTIQNVGVIAELDSLTQALANLGPNACPVATSDQTSSQLFCADAFAFVCGADSSYETRALDSHTAYADWAVPTYKQTVEAADKTKRAEAYRKFYTEAYSTGLAQAGGEVGKQIKLEDLERLVERAKKQAITTLRGKGLTPHVLSAAESRINATKFYTIEEMVEESLMDKKAASFNQTCYRDGQLPNAELVEGEDEQSRVLICPSLVASVAYFASDLPDFESRMEFMILHEVAHSVDGHSSLRSDPTAEIYASMLEGLTPDANEYRLSRTAHEISADFLAIESQIANPNFSKSSRDELALILKSRYESLCTDLSKRAKNHPSPKWRINFMASQPRVRELLGCAK